MFSEFIVGQVIHLTTGVVSTEIMVHDWIGTLVIGEAIGSQGFELGFQGSSKHFLSEVFSNYLELKNIQTIIVIFAANVTRKSMKYNLKRPVANHFLQTFIPSMMISLTSAASVFIPSDNPGRMGMVITSFLSLVSLFNGAR